MDYDLNKDSGNAKRSTFISLKTLVGSMVKEKKTLVTAFAAMLITTLLTLLGPLIIGHTIDTYVTAGRFQGVLVFSAILLVMYIISLGAGYIQTKLMGTVGQHLLFTLRNTVFNKLQELPLDFFNRNKAGDLISRINNDSDKINQFFSQSLMQFIKSILVMAGSAIFLISINLPLGLAALSPALLIWVFTRASSPWIKKFNAVSLRNFGNLNAEIQESLTNFKVIAAFNRRDYFRKRFEEVNRDNYTTSVKAGIANNMYMPVYTLLSHVGQLVVLAFGIYLIGRGQFTIGLLISFIAYIASFYNPLRQLAALWANFQVALAAWDRILKILNLKTNMPVINAATLAEQTNGGYHVRKGKGNSLGNIPQEDSSPLLSFRNVSFSYPNGSEVLHNINFDLYRGMTYAFVGPTGGGKTTTASLIARLYDPGKGTILLEGRDIRSFKHEERVKKTGFILQDPFLFSGTMKENLLYGNDAFRNMNNRELSKIIRDAGLENLLERFDNGLDTEIDTSSDSTSLGQRQLIAFIRAVLRKPQLLILDEATANIDTVTEKLLEEILHKLPEETTKVIIAHRLNTIAGADVIYFVNSGNITHAGSLSDAMTMLMQGQKKS